jgi:hypothetical protein
MLNWLGWRLFFVARFLSPEIQEAERMIDEDQETIKALEQENEKLRVVLSRVEDAIGRHEPKRAVSQISSVFNESENMFLFPLE